MVDPKGFEVEFGDDLSRDTSQFNGTVNTTGATISTSNGEAIQLTSIHVPARGPNANSPTAILLVSWDGVTYTSYPRGANEHWPGKGHGTKGQSIHVKAYTGTVKYEIKLVKKSV